MTIRSGVGESHEGERMKLIAALVVLAAIGFAFARAEEVDDTEIVLSDMPLETVVQAARQVH